MIIEIKNSKQKKIVTEDPEKIIYPDETPIAEDDPEIIPFEDPFESPPDELPVPGEGP